MIAKTMTYKDFNNVERTETFYFNLTPAEAVEMQVMESGGLGVYIDRIIQEQDARKIIEIFKDLILRSYGVKSNDGKHFLKDEKLRAAFASTNAYSDLFMQLATDADMASAFLNGIVPQLSEEEVAKFSKNAEQKAPSEVTTL